MTSEESKRDGQIELLGRLLLSAMPIVGGPAEIVFSEISARRRTRLLTTLDEITTSVGEAQLRLTLGEDPLRDAAFTAAVQAAVETGIEAKRRLLAKAAAAATLDDAKLDEAIILTSVLAELDVPHIRCLARMADEWERTDDPPEGKVSFGDSAVFSAEHEAVKAALVRTGTARRSQRVRAMATKNRQEGITDFGLRLVAQLRAEGLGEHVS